MASQPATAYWQIMIPIAGSIIVAILGWMFTYFHKRSVDKRNDKLERVNDQLRLVYGPLYAQLHAANATWNAFCQKYWPAHGGRTYFCDGKNVTDEEKARWRLWMKEVFHPLNLQIQELIVGHMDLLEGDEIPESFLIALAHISAYNAILKQWELGDYSEHLSVCNFPDKELMEAVEPIFFQLRMKQEQLISRL